MKVVTASAFRNDLFNLMDETGASSEPLFITTKRGNFVMMSQEDYNALEETLLLASDPEIVQGVHDALKGKGVGINWRDA